MTQDSKESTLSRWSRRKIEARQAEAQPTAADETAPAADPPEVAAEEEKPVLTDADMPDIDTLTEDSDFSPFMSAGVSDELRNLALRKLFRAPVFNIRDGLDEYDDDFTQFEKLGSIITSDMKHRLEMEQQKLREQLAEQEAAPDAADGDRATRVEDEDETDAIEEIEEIDDADHTPPIYADDAGAQSETKQDT